jgi:hypothetical protein
MTSRAKLASRLRNSTKYSGMRGDAHELTLRDLFDPNNHVITGAEAMSLRACDAQCPPGGS